MAQNRSTNEPAPRPPREDEHGEQRPGHRARSDLPPDPAPEEVPELLGERSDYPPSRE